MSLGFAGLLFIFKKYIPTLCVCIIWFNEFCFFMLNTDVMQGINYATELVFYLSITIPD